MSMKVKDLVLVNHGFNWLDIHMDIEESVNALIHEEYEYYREEVEDGFFYCKLFPSGLALYGYTKYADPLHNNERYTWSSRPSVINRIFGLDLNKLDIGLRTYNPKQYECYYSVGIKRDVLEKMLQQAIDDKVIRVAKSDCSPIEWELDINSVDSILTNQ